MTDSDADLALECLAWTPTPHIIGTRGHTHTCRLPHQHDGHHNCNGCGRDF